MRSLLLLTSAWILLRSPTVFAGSTLGSLGKNVSGGTPIAGTWLNICNSPFGGLPYCTVTGNVSLWGLSVPAQLYVAADMIATFVTLFIGSFAIIMIIFGGIRIITSTGEPDKIKAGRQAILYGLLGVFLAIISEMLFLWMRLFLLAAAS